MVNLAFRSLLKKIGAIVCTIIHRMHIKHMKKNKLIEDDGSITQKGKELSSVVSYIEELN